MKTTRATRALTRVKTKSQVTIPKAVLARTGIKVGDLLEARVSSQGVLLVPQTVVDKKLEALLIEGLESGPAAPMTRKDWDDIRREGRKRIAAARKKA